MPKSKKTADDRTKTTISLKVEVMKRLRLLAAARGVDMTVIVEEAVEARLKKDEAKLTELERVADSFTPKK